MRSESKNMQGLLVVQDAAEIAIDSYKIPDLVMKNPSHDFDFITWFMWWHI